MFSGIADKLLKVFASIVEWFYESLIEPFKELPTLERLIFGTYREGKLVWGTFEPSNLTDGFQPLFNSMMILAGFALVILIVTYAMRIAGAPLNPSRRNEGIEFIKDLIIVGVLLMNLPIFYDLLFNVNSAIVNMFNGAMDSNLDEIKNQEQDFGDEAIGLIGWIFVQLVLLGLTIWASFYYMMRKVTLLILMGMGPLMVVFWLQPQLKGMTSAWLRELIGSIFVQAIHAFVFWTVAVISATSTGLIETVIVYVIFIPISEAIRRLLNMGGDMQGGFAKAGAMMGMAGLAGMYGATKGALDGRSVMGAVKGAYDGAKNGKGKAGEGSGEDGDDLKKTLGGGPGGDTGTTPRAEKMLKAGDIVGKMGKATMGMAGSIAGMGLGPVGSMAGASAGFAAGGVVGGLTGRVGAAAMQGIGDRLKKGKDDGLDFYKNKTGGDFDDAMANDIADRETASWADSNKAAEMSALRERFPDASESDLDKKFNQMKDNKRAGFYNSAVSQLRSARTAAGGGDVDSLASDMADSETASWESANKSSQMKKLQASFPDATAEELEEKYNDIKSSKRAGFLKQAKAQLGSAQGMANGSELVGASAQAMASQWATDNQESFFADYDKSNPQKDGETAEAYGTRRQAAFDKKVAGVKKSFADAGNQYIADNGLDEDGLVSKSGFMQHMGQAAKSAGGNVENLASANENAISHVQGSQMFDKKGVPNVNTIASGMAQAKTAEMRSSFINGQTEKGISEADAIKDWGDNHQSKVFAQNLSSYQSSAQTAADSVKGMSSSKVGAAIQGIGVGAARTTGLTAIAGGVKTLQSGFQAVGDGGRHAVVQAATLNDEGANPVMAVASASKSGWQHASQQFFGQRAEEQGGVVQAHANHQNNSGYGAGVIFGAAGYQTGKKMANKFSPYAKQVQSAVHSPGEVMQMAQTTEDSHGNVSIAPGAIRQVTTATESYIEVKTKGGETQIVSRMGSGHSGMKKGDVVYQDLVVEGDSLVASSPTAYRLDSAGGRAPSSVQVHNDPSTILGSARSGHAHQPAARKDAPVFSQAVDSGSFYTQDLAEQGFENVQVVIEKDRQYVTGQKDGSTYRVSQMYAGDSRLDNGQTVNIPVEVSSNGIKAKSSPNSQVAVDSNISIDGVPTEDSIPYYSTKSTRGLIDNLDDLITSKHTDRANRSVDRRKELEELRRKQGILG